MINCVLYLLAGAAAGLIVNGVLYYSPLRALWGSYDAVSSRFYGVDFPMGILLYGILAPVLEELLFRMGLYDFLYRRTGFVPAMLLSSLAFGLYHMNLIQGIYAFLMGILICFIYRKDHRSFVPVILHAGANLAVYLSSLPVQ